ncbi:MAG: hypothetical protein L3J31_02580 [Bacteroidales bacterium]|nr:hypothetical protein [Bacteroidales bacterium]MCF6341677.1 hypothetical protein [Bacteroidales bacterium]
METNELQNTWKELNMSTKLKTKEELEQVLTRKSRQTLNQFVVVVGMASLVCAVLVTFLFFTAMNRPDDKIYQLNNLVLGLVTVIALISSLYSWHRLQHNKYELSVKVWLENNINLLSGWLSGIHSRLYLFLIPFIYILTVLSIHVYFENKPFTEVFRSAETVIGLLVAAPVGLFVSYYVARKIRKQYSEKLEYLKYLYNCLCRTD